MASHTTPPELAGVERAVDALMLALTAAGMRGDVVGPDDFRDALTQTHAGWIGAEISRLLGPYVHDRWLPSDVVAWLSAAWSSVAVDQMAIITDLLIEMRRLTGKPPAEVLREVRERAEQGVSDA